MEPAIPASTGDSHPAHLEFRVFDEAAHDAGCGITDSRALRGAREEANRLWASAQPPAPPRFWVGRLAMFAGMVFVLILWSIAGGWFIAGFVAVLIVVYEVHRHRDLRRGRRFREGHCRSCSYPTAGLADAIAPSLIRGLRVGPAVCPECGTRWPRLPPQ